MLIIFRNEAVAGSHKTLDQGALDHRAIPANGGRICGYALTNSMAAAIVASDNSSLAAFGHGALSRHTMKIFVRALVVIWALVSVGLGALAFAAVFGTGASAGAAAYEAIETIPEAALQMMGFDGSPLWIDAGYWILLTAALLFAFKRS